MTEIKENETYMLALCFFLWKKKKKSTQENIPWSSSTKQTCIILVSFTVHTKKRNSWTGSNSVCLEIGWTKVEDMCSSYVFFTYVFFTFFTRKLALQTAYLYDSSALQRLDISMQWVIHSFFSSLEFIFHLNNSTTPVANRIRKYSILSYAFLG